jgi:branched-chain amino acid transport system substrate-binding protein
MEAVRKLIDINNVSIIIGPHTSGETIPTSTYSGSKGVPQISISATSPLVRELGPHHFSVVGLDDLVGKLMAQFAWEDAGVEKWGIMTANSDYGIGIGRVMEEEIEEQGGNVVGFVTYEAGKTDYRAELERLFSDNPEAIMIVTWGEMAYIQFKQAYEMGLFDQTKDKWYSPYPSNITTGEPETIEGVKGLDVAWGSTRAEKFTERFKEEFPDEEPNAYSARSFDAVWIAALAMNISGSTEPKRIMEVLPFVFEIYRGVFSDDMSVDEDGMPKKQPCWAWIVRNGKLEMYTDRVYGM